MGHEEIAVDMRYLNDDQNDQHQFCPYLREWPPAASEFITRRATALREGSHFPPLPIDALLQLIGGFVATGTHESLTMRLQIALHGDQLWMAVDVLHRGLIMTPLQADNAGTFEFALRWYAQHPPEVVVGISAGGLFWVHEQQQAGSLR